MIDMKNIGYNAKMCRQSHGISQRQVAEALGYGVTNISAFECGLNHNMKILIYYMQRFGFDPFEIKVRG